MATQNIDSLKLSTTAKKGAQLLLKEHPEVVFTSGLRDLEGQASAMASHVAGKRDWIKNTYAANAASAACQKWVDDNPQAVKKSDIAAGLLDTLKKLGKTAGLISKHLTGDAFDVRPVSQNADAIKKTMRTLPGAKKFFEKEGGDVVWHVQF